MHVLYCGVDDVECKGIMEYPLSISRHTVLVASRTPGPGVSSLLVPPPPLGQQHHRTHNYMQGYQVFISSSLSFSSPRTSILKGRSFLGSKKMMPQQGKYILHAALRFSSPRQSFIWRLCSAVAIISNRHCHIAFGCSRIRSWCNTALLCLTNGAICFGTGAPPFALWIQNRCRCLCFIANSFWLFFFYIFLYYWRLRLTF